MSGDKGYSYPHIRRSLRRHSISSVAPQPTDQRQHHRGRPLAFDKNLYRQRRVIEYCVVWLKECRAIATRFEKLAAIYLAVVKRNIILQ